MELCKSLLTSDKIVLSHVVQSKFPLSDFSALLISERETTAFDLPGFAADLTETISSQHVTHQGSQQIISASLDNNVNMIAISVSCMKILGLNNQFDAPFGISSLSPSEVDSMKFLPIGTLPSNECQVLALAAKVSNVGETHN